jgi:hypothetical protein
MNKALSIIGPICAVLTTLITIGGTVVVWIYAFQSGLGWLVVIVYGCAAVFTTAYIWSRKL